MSNCRRKRKKHISRRQRSERQQRVLWITTGVIGSVILALLSYGFWQQTQVMHTPVAEVTLTNGDVANITRKQFYVRVRFERSRYYKKALNDPSYIDPLADVYGFGQMILERMALEVLVREAAEQHDLSVSDEEIEAHILQAYGTGEGVLISQANPIPHLDASGPTPTPPMTDLKRKYRVDRRIWRSFGLTDAAMEDLVRSYLLEIQLRERLGDAAFETWLEEARSRITWMEDWHTDIPDQPEVKLNDNLEE